MFTNQILKCKKNNISGWMNYQLNIFCEYSLPNDRGLGLGRREQRIIHTSPEKSSHENLYPENDQVNISKVINLQPILVLQGIIYSSACKRTSIAWFLIK